MKNNTARYIGRELEVFSQARNWKYWWTSLCAPYIRGQVLEVGAGTGVNILPIIQAVTKHTSDQLHCPIDGWLALEPDEALCQQIPLQYSNSHSFTLKPVPGYLESLSPNLYRTFDSIIYIDVLEHIENDVEEIAQAWNFLHDGGHLIILVPSRPELFTAFDKAIGHFRRYTPATLKRCLPEQAQFQLFEYLDFWGTLFPLLNRLLRSSTPSLTAIRAWDGILVPMSRLTNILTRKLYGKSLFCVVSKPGTKD